MTKATDTQKLGEIVTTLRQTQKAASDLAIHAESDWVVAQANSFAINLRDILAEIEDDE